MSIVAITFLVISCIVALEYVGVKKMMTDEIRAGAHMETGLIYMGIEKPMIVGDNKGGFKSIESTPDLADVGCETCHGPGSEHAETQDPQSITRKPAVATCTECHNSERIQDFKFKPLMFSGAH